MANMDKRIVGLNPWHWDYDTPDPRSPWINQFNAGAQQYPKLLYAMGQKGKTLPRLAPPPPLWLGRAEQGAAASTAGEDPRDPGGLPPGAPGIAGTLTKCCGLLTK